MERKIAKRRFVSFRFVSFRFPLSVADFIGDLYIRISAFYFAHINDSKQLNYNT
jgi:hypothetical protein